MIAAGRIADLSWAAAGRTHPGEDTCGDRHRVVEGRECALLAVIDGLGHGPSAAAAASAIAERVEELADIEPREAFARLHDAAKRTRGAAVTMAWIGADGALTWSGVGNVEGVLHRGADRVARVLTRGGIIGHRYDPVLPREAHVAPGDVLALYTDGLDEALSHDLRLAHPRGDLAALAAELVETHAKAHDDSLLLVARRGGAR